MADAMRGKISLGMLSHVFEEEASRIAEIQPTNYITL